MPIVDLFYLVLSRDRVINQNAMVVRPTDNGSINPLFCPRLIPDTKQEIDEGEEWMYYFLNKKRNSVYKETQQQCPWQLHLCSMYIISNREFSG